MCDTFSALVDTQDCLVPSRYHEDPKLRNWVGNMRAAYSKLHTTESDQDEVVTSWHNGKRLNADRLRRLESIGFEWHPRTRKAPPKSDSMQTESKAEKMQATATYGALGMPPNMRGYMGALMTQALGTGYRPGSNGLNLPALLSPQLQAPPFYAHPILAAPAAGQTRQPASDFAHYYELEQQHLLSRTQALARRKRKSDEHWEQMFQRLKAYKAKHGVRFMKDGTHCTSR